MTYIRSHTSKTGHNISKENFSNCIYDQLLLWSTQLNNSFCDENYLKIKLSCLKKELSRQITEKQQNDKMTTTNDVIRQKRDMM